MMLCQNAHIAAHIHSRKKLAKQCGAAKKGKCYRYTSRGHSQPTNTEAIVLETSRMRGFFECIHDP
jgi:hypothetical protein